VRVTTEMVQIQGTLALLIGPRSYGIEDAWLEPLRPLLGATMSFEALVDALEAAALNSERASVIVPLAKAWASRISQKDGDIDEVGT